jgi:hypothetical protein
MRFRLAFSLISAAAAICNVEPAAAQYGQQPPTQIWYYCDPARAYYPYVATCSAPWRPVSPQPRPYAAAPYWSPPTQQIYQQGLQPQQQEAARSKSNRR